MPIDKTKLVASDLWRDQIERPEDVDYAIGQVEAWIKILQRKRINLRSLRRLSVQVYGEPNYGEMVPEEKLLWGNDHDGDRTGEDDTDHADGPTALLQDPNVGDPPPGNPPRKGNRPGRRVPTRFQTPPAD